MNTKHLLWLAAIAAPLASCSNDGPKNPEETGDKFFEKAAFVLNQGEYGHAVEGTLTEIDMQFGISEEDVFRSANGRSLGDTPQCMTVYGDKLYIGVYGSSTIEILDRRHLKSLKQIKLEDLDMGMQPRSFATHGGKVYISMYSGEVARLDTLSLTLDAKVKVGPNPDIIAVYKDKLYVPNSDGMNYLVGYGTTASIVDLASFTVEKTIDTPLNPTEFLTDGERIFLRSTGNYWDVPSLIYEMNPTDCTFTEIGKATMVTIRKNDLLMVSFPWDAEPEFTRYDFATRSTSPFALTGLDAITSIKADFETGTVIATSSPFDGKNANYLLPGNIVVYDKDFKEKWSYAGGTGPAAIAFDM